MRELCSLRLRRCRLRSSNQSCSYPRELPRVIAGINIWYVPGWLLVSMENSRYLVSNLECRHLCRRAVNSCQSRECISEILGQIAAPAANAKRDDLAARYIFFFFYISFKWKWVSVPKTLRRITISAEMAAMFHMHTRFYASLQNFRFFCRNV